MNLFPIVPKLFPEQVRLLFPPPPFIGGREQYARGSSFFPIDFPKPGNRSKPKTKTKI